MPTTFCEPAPTMDAALADLLQSVRWHFYSPSADPTSAAYQRERGMDRAAPRQPLRLPQRRESDPAALRRFHRDRRMLLYALTWPAVWLERRGLTCPPGRYRALIAERLDAIGAHGDPACYSAYFPRYLLKCLQDWFERHGDDLYGDLKHIRNALDQVLASARFAERVQRDARQLDVLVATPIAVHAAYPPTGTRYRPRCASPAFAVSRKCERWAQPFPHRILHAQHTRHVRSDPDQLALF